MSFNWFTRWIHFFMKQPWPFRINLPRVALQNFFIYTTLQMQSIYFSGLGGSALQLGIVSSAGLLVGGLVSIPSGWFVDQYGVKKIFLSGNLLIGLGSLMFALANHLLMASFSLFLIIFSWRFTMNMCPTVCANCLKDEERATGMQICDTISAAPKLLAPTVAAALVTLFGGLNVAGIRPLYYIQFVGFALIFVFTKKLFTEPVPVEKRNQRRVDNFKEDFISVFNKGIKIKTWIVYRTLAYGPWWVGVTYWPLFVKQVKGAGQYTIGFIQTAMWVLPLFLAIPMGRLADSFGRKIMIYISTPLYCFSLLIFIHAPNKVVLIASGLLQGLLILSSVIQGAMQVELMPIKYIGKWIGIMGLVQGISGTVFPTLAGWIWNSLGPYYVFYFMIAISLLSLVLLTRIPETLNRGLPTNP